MSTTIAPEKREFQAEVSQVLDIVIHSLYTDKEIFVRELVSNASDALEKLRHLQLTESAIHGPELPLEIQLSVDEEAKTLTIADHGLGMTREELHENLGTIAHSGSKAFLRNLEESARKESALIGQFGVGFYSAFMVADEVTVYSRSWRPEAESLVWTSDGKTGYEIAEAEEELSRGCRIVLKLREDCADFATTDRVRSIVENYSNFVSFPVMIGEDRVNKVEAIWRKKKNDVTDEEYNEFYKFSAKAYDAPRYRMHFNADSPIELNALLFVPTENTELWGMGQMEPGVSLYCKNVLIDDKPEGLLPEWLRFLRGVIDSADIPLNISRESMQDSSLVRKLNRVVTKRFLKFLDGEAKDNADKYREFYAKFSRFLKEGVVTDFDHREGLAKLLRFESSMTDPGTLTGFEDYLTRAKDGQDKIYYLAGTDRASVEAGPYLEALKARGLEVIYFLDSIDEYLLQHLREFDGKSLVSAASSEVELSDDASVETPGEPLGDEAMTALCEFLTTELGERVEKVAPGKRLVSSPAAVLAPAHGMSAQMRQMLQAMNPGEPLPPQKVELELNPRHGLVHALAAAREGNPELAKLAAAQLLDNALLAAGLLEDRVSLIDRGFRLMEAALKKSTE
ncbi:MAG: molecular chaperone HtpG [Verrucomicrobiales bacterium]|nr:molecular chaperone HtpG [Verrucomicrobiales bacterium]